MKTVDDVPNNDDDDDDDDDDDALLIPFQLVHIFFVWQSSLLKSLPCFQI